MVAAIVLFRSQRAENALTGEDESAIRGLLELYGKNDSLGYFATRRDKSVVFAPNGRAAITYRVEVGVCLASGDPIGDPRGVAAGDRGVAGAVPGVRLGPGGDGRERGWRRRRSARPDSTRSSSATRRSCTRPTSGCRGPDMRAVRQAVTRARRAGLHRADPPPPRHRPRGDGRRRSSAPTPGATPRPSAASRWRSAGSAIRPTATACWSRRCDARRTSVVAMLSLVPGAPTGVSLDLMRRRRSRPNGTTELMVSRAVPAGADLGVSRISLNFAMFRSAFEEGAQIGAGPVARLWRRLLLFFSRWWQLETLYRSNMKYRPEWVPRFLCYEDARADPAGRRRLGRWPRASWCCRSSRRDEQHTGHHAAVPPTLAAIRAAAPRRPPPTSADCRPTGRRRRRPGAPARAGPGAAWPS